MLNQNNPIHFNSRNPRVQVIQRKPRNYNHLKPVYQTMKWKDFALQGGRKNSIDNVQRLSAKNSIRGHNSPSYHQQAQHRQYNNYTNHNNNIVTSRLSQRNLREENMRLSGTKYHPREQQLHRVKQQALHRVKLLQQKVLPLISHQHEQYRNNEQEYGLSWQLKMQQRLIKIQNNIENIKNQMEIKMEKKLIEMEKVWEHRFNQLVQMWQDNHTNMNNNANINQINNNYQLHNNNNINSEQHQISTYYHTQSSNGFRHQHQQQQLNYNSQLNNNNNNNNNNIQNYKYYKSGFNQDDNQQY